MTILEALSSYFSYGSDNAKEICLDKVSLTGADTYIFATHDASVQLASAYLMQMAYTAQDISEQDAKIAWNRDSILKRMNKIFADNNLQEESLFSNQITIKKNVFGD